MTREEQIIVRKAIVDAMENARESVSDPGDRLAAFFGYLVGRAGFDDPCAQLDYLSEPGDA